MRKIGSKRRLAAIAPLSLCFLSVLIFSGPIIQRDGDVLSRQLNFECPNIDILISLGK